MKEAKQTINGKAFEYAILKTFRERLEHITKVAIIDNDSHKIAQKYFLSFNSNEQGHYLLAASFAVNFLMDIEPRLVNGISNDDILELEIAPDSRGQQGDVRDVLAIRILQKWEIGISAKNNHKAVKHSRLSKHLNFGNKWLGVPCSRGYFAQIEPIFSMLEKIRKQNKPTPQWSFLGDYHTSVYVPILNAFKDELIRLDQENPGFVAENLIRYLIGNQDFYKVIKWDNRVEIQAYNLHGSLNMSFKDVKPKIKIQRLKFPTRLIEVAYQDGSQTTLLVTLNEGWQISFRIHNASSKIEPSLKFDINLVSAPHTLFTNQLYLP